jgi:phosphate starvation-inducible PhoH-like protein
MRPKVGRKSTKPNFRELENIAAQVVGPQRKKKWSKHDIKPIHPLTTNQKEMFHQYYQGDNIGAFGSAGAGKSFIGCYLGISDVVSPDYDQTHLIIVRSAVQSRDQGFMPGNLEEKQAYFELPYKEIMAELFGREATYDDMKEAGLIQFMTTSFVRGLSWHNAVILVDEVQNMNFDEIDSIMTRVGKNSRVIVCGDHKKQNDLTKNSRDVSGIHQLLKVVENMKTFTTVTFTKEDCVRGPFAKEWICAVEAVE